MALRFLDVLLTVYVYTGYASSPAPLIGVFHNTLIASEASFLVCSMRGFSIYMFIYIFQAVRRAVNVLNVSTCI